MFEVLEIGKLLEPINGSIALHPDERHGSPAHQRPLCPLKYFIERSYIFDGLPFLYFTYIYDIIFHSICNLELLEIPT